jgi:predicted phosphodiesterase
MSENTGSRELGREAAYLHWYDGITWTDLDEHYWPEHSYSKIRSAARRYRNSHPDEFPQAETPTETLDLGVNYEEFDNTATATANTTDIHTLAQLLKAINYNPLVWRVRDWDARAYSGWRGNMEKEMTWKDGKIVNGYVKDGGIITKTLWSVWAKFVKHQPIAIEPVIQPIKVSTTYAPPKPTPTNLIRVLIVTDTHFGYRRIDNVLQPYHDPLACDISLQIARTYKPDLILHLGDLMDFEEWSTHYVKEPECVLTTQPAIITSGWYAQQLREACPTARIVWIEGNHGKRLRTYIMTHMLHGYKLASVKDLTMPVWSIPNLLDFETLHIEPITGYPKAKHWITDTLVASHGKHALAPGNTARRVSKNSSVHHIFGHIHRNEFMVTSQFNRGPNTEVLSYGVGALCRTDGFLPGATEDCQWQQGMAIVEVRPSSPARPYIDNIPIKNGKALWRGQLYTGSTEGFDELKSQHPKHWPTSS